MSEANQCPCTPACPLQKALTWLGGKWKLYARASALAYPLMKEKKPGKAELKLQVAADF